MPKSLCLLAACLLLSGCLRGAVGTAGTVTGAAIRTTGNVVGGAVEVVTRNPHLPTEFTTP